MSQAANRFYNSIQDSTAMGDRELIGLFAYFLTVEMGEDSVTSKRIDDCFRECDLSPPTRTSQMLSEGVQSGSFVKANPGYKLQRHYRQELQKKLGAAHVVVQSSAELRKLETKMPLGGGKNFLKETIDCFEAGANRATIVMCWILALDHLIDYTMLKHLPAFNEVLGRNTDKRVKVNAIKTRDDFGDIPEGKLIEFLRTAGVISNDVRKILDEKLGTRNTSAHPSSVAIKPSKVVEFVDDLVENVILKYSE